MDLSQCSTGHIKATVERYDRQIAEMEYPSVHPASPGTLTHIRHQREILKREIERRSRSL